LIDKVQLNFRHEVRVIVCQYIGMFPTVTTKYAGNAQFSDFSFSGSVVDGYDSIGAIYLITNPSFKKNKGLRRVVSDHWSQKKHSETL